MGEITVTVRKTQKYAKYFVARVHRTVVTDAPSRTHRRVGG